MKMINFKLNFITIFLFAVPVTGHDIGYLLVALGISSAGAGLMWWIDL